MMSRATIFMLVPMLMIQGCGRSDSAAQVVHTQLDQIVSTTEGMTDACQHGLKSVGNDLISHKKHFLQRVQNSPDSQVVRIVGTLIYNDRPSHVELTAEPSAQGCDIRYDLSYQLNISCLTAREEAFKKWLHRGKLGETTQYYVHKRNPNKSAYLTNISRNLQCLVNVSVSKSVNNATPVNQSDVETETAS